MQPHRMLGYISNREPLAYYGAEDEMAQIIDTMNKGEASSPRLRRSGGQQMKSQSAGESRGNTPGGETTGFRRGNFNFSNKKHLLLVSFHDTINQSTVAFLNFRIIDPKMINVKDIIAVKPP